VDVVQARRVLFRSFEETLQQRLNEAGGVATAEGLKQFDTDGSPITVGPVKLTTKGQVEKDYQTPYGVATVARHVYQGPQGGVTFCPLDRDARIVVTSTPRFAKIVSHTYAEFSSPRVQIDLQENSPTPSGARSRRAHATDPGGRDPTTGRSRPTTRSTRGSILPPTPSRDPRGSRCTTTVPRS
jgi:hypothetical protein